MNDYNLSVKTISSSKEQSRIQFVAPHFQFILTLTVISDGMNEEIEYHPRYNNLEEEMWVVVDTYKNFMFAESKEMVWN